MKLVLDGRDLKNRHGVGWGADSKIKDPRIIISEQAVSLVTSFRWDLKIDIRG